MKPLSWDEIRKFPHGTKVRVKIDLYRESDATISLGNNKIYICQEVADGNKAPDKLGHKYSWEIDNMNHYQTQWDLTSEDYPIF